MTTTIPSTVLAPEELAGLDAYWRAANYLSVGQIYLLDNPLLREPLRPEHVKPRLLGHWGTTPGLNFVYAHLNRVICARDLERHLHLRPRPRRARAWSPTPGWRARYSEIYPTITADAAGHARRCSGSSPSRAASPATPPPRHPGPSTRAASSATPCPTPTARPSTTPTWSWPA